LALINLPASSVSFLGRRMIDETIALFNQGERLSLYHFKTRSAIAKIALAPLRIL
jgi:hypothetical protein